MFGGIAAVVIGPLAALASERAYAVYIGEIPPPPDRLVPLLTFSDPPHVYATYGRLWVPIVLLFLSGAWAVRTAWEPVLSRWGKRGATLLTVGLAFQVPGNIGDYWLGSARIGQLGWGASFLLTLLGLGLVSIGGVLLGITIVRSRRLPWVTGLALALLPVGFLLAPVVPNLPAAATIVAGVTWTVTGATLVRNPAATAA